MGLYPLPAHQPLAWKEVRCGCWCSCQVTGCEHRQFLGRKQNAWQEVAQKPLGFVVQICLGATELISCEMVSNEAAP